MLDVGDVAVPDAVDLEVVHAVPGELVGPGVQERLRGGRVLRVVDVVIRAAAVVVVRLVVGGVGDDVPGVVTRALDRGVLVVGGHRDARGQVHPELLAEAVDVTRHRRHAVGEPGRVGDPAAVGVDGGLRVEVQEVVHVDVGVAVRDETAGRHGLRLGLDVRLGGIGADEAPTAPAHRRRGRDPLRLRGGRRGRSAEGQRDGGQRHRDGQDAAGGAGKPERADLIDFTRDLRRGDVTETIRTERDQTIAHVTASPPTPVKRTDAIRRSVVPTN